jgi:glycosyltransferase involved in cell wall biosynthesis
MRIGLLIYGSLDTVSGGYLYDRKLVAHLRNQGDRVEIVSIPWRNYLSHLGDNFNRSLRHTLRRLPVDVLVQDELNHPSLVWLNKTLQAPYPIISLVHHLRCDELRPGWQNAVYRLVERRYLDSVDGFIFNSQTTKESVAERAPINGRPWVIATPAGDRFDPKIERESMDAVAGRNGPLRLIFVGNLIPRKGLHTLIEALGLLEADCCNLDVVGSLETDRGYVRRIFRRVDSLGLQNRVQFHGLLDDEFLSRIYEQSQVLVVPSSFEGFGIVYLEGMRFGLPGIGTNQGGAKEIIRPDETGYLMEPGDATGLANLLRKLHRDRAKLHAMRLNAWQHQRQFPRWEESMAKVRHFLQRVVSNWL